MQNQERDARKRKKRTPKLRRYLVGIGGQAGMKPIRGPRGWELHEARVPNNDVVYAVFRRGREYRKYYVQDIDGRWIVEHPADLAEAWVEPRALPGESKAKREAVPRRSAILRLLAWTAAVLGTALVGWTLNSIGG